MIHITQVVFSLVLVIYSFKIISGKMPSISMQGTYLILLNACMDTSTHLLFLSYNMHKYNWASIFYIFNWRTHIFLSNSQYAHLIARKESKQKELKFFLTFPKVVFWEPLCPQWPIWSDSLPLCLYSPIYAQTKHWSLRYYLIKWFILII